MNQWLEFALFLCALSLAGYFAVSYHYRGQVVALDLFEVALAPAVFTLPAQEVVWLALGATAISQALRRVTPARALFNVLQQCLAAAAGCWVFALLRSPGTEPTRTDLAALALAMVVVLLVGVLALTGALAMYSGAGRGGWLLQALPRLVRDSAVPGAVSVVWGVLFAATYRWTPGAVPLLLIPLAVLHWANRSYALGRAEQARLRTLHRATQVLLAQPEPEKAIPAFLAETGRGFSWDVVELVLFDGDGRTVHRHQQGPPGPYEHFWQPKERRTVASFLLASGVGPGKPVHVNGRHATGELAALLAEELRGDAVAAVVSMSDGETCGLLCAYDRGGAAAFPERELHYFQALADELAAALQRSDLDARLVAERAKLAHIVEGTADGIATVGTDGRVRTWNQAFERITGYAVSATVGSSITEVLQPVDEHGRPVDLDPWATRTGMAVLPSPLIVRTGSGRMRTLACSYSASRNPVAGASELVVVARDVTDERRTRRLLDTERTVFARMAEGAELAVVLEALVSSIAPEDSALSCEVLLRDDATGALRRAAGGAEKPAARASSGELVSYVVPVPAERGAPALGEVRVTGPRGDALIPGCELMERAAHLAAIAVARSRSEQLLRYRATHDPVTGLPNRVVFLDRCEQALARARRGQSAVIVTFLDLDRFKVVNDSLGHDTGDRLLVAVGQRLTSVLRPEDTVARFGGDEFTILCEGMLDEKHVLSPARRIQSALTAPFLVGDREVFVSASMGVAACTGEGSADLLVGQADAAMYRAKERGGNRWELFDDAMRARAQGRMALQTAMHRGLERGEFEVHYQPLVSLVERRITGAEALLRWRHPERGLLPPSEYIALAESNGLIVPIGEHVLRTACAQLMAWQEDTSVEHPQSMSINLSARQFMQSDLADMVSRAITESGVDPASISFEITETSAMDDVGATVAAMEELKALGVGLVIDDFGTGYSSLTYLKRFPVDGLKVDRSFVAGLGTDDDDSAIVTAVIDLAHSLGMVAVAEGVENAEQLERLRELGCDTAQGYHLGRPQPASAF